MKALVPLLALFALVSMHGCSSDTGTIVKRVTSPDGVLDAVLVRDPSGGATVGWYYSVYLCLANSKEMKWPVARITDVSFLGDGVRWASDSVLEIRYSVGIVDRFQNRWHSRDVDNFRREVEIVLAPLRPGASLPVAQEAHGD